MGAAYNLVYYHNPRNQDKMEISQARIESPILCSLDRHDARIPAHGLLYVEPAANEWSLIAVLIAPQPF
jgi:hypothetical protein